MFVAEAIADFSSTVIEPQETDNNQTQNLIHTHFKQQQQHQKEQQKEYQEQREPKVEKENEDQKYQQDLQQQQQQQHSQEQQEQQHSQQQPQGAKRLRQNDHQQELAAQEQPSTSYISFKTGQKILVRQTDDSGWWYGNVIGQEEKGFFPSTFVKCGAKPPRPELPPEPSTKDWMTDELEKMHQGPVQSEYYQGIIGHKLVKIDDKNKNLLKANYVKYNQATGLASVPIKSQAPNAKAVRQMGYYFDYHQWIDERNNLPDVKARPDVRRKKKKKLNLVLFGEDRERANQKNKKQ